MICVSNSLICKMWNLLPSFHTFVITCWGNKVKLLMHNQDLWQQKWMVSGPGLAVLCVANATHLDKCPISKVYRLLISWYLHDGLDYNFFFLIKILIEATLYYFISLLECTAHLTLRQMGYNSSGPYQVPLLSVRSMNLRQQLSVERCFSAHRDCRLVICVTVVFVDVLCISHHSA